MKKKIERKKHNICTKCHNEKNESTNPWCNNCVRENNSKKTHCRCGNLKENLHHPVCNPCNRKYSKSSTENRFIKQSKEICKDNIELINFVKKVERRGGWCDMFEIFELMDIWESVNTNTVKYDNLTATKQIERMWRDVKKIYHASKN
jgi:hypothetical protein